MYHRVLRYWAAQRRYEDALHWAIQHETVVQLLLAKGADVNAKNNCGQTALSWVARDGPSSVAQILLIDHNADVNIQDKYGCEKSHEAAFRGRKDMLQFLLEQGLTQMLRTKMDGHPCTWQV